jgi:hypothetical protein
MSKLPHRLLISFKSAYRNQFGEDLTDEEADRLGFWFVDFLGTVATIRANHLRRKSEDDENLAE